MHTSWFCPHNKRRFKSIGRNLRSSCMTLCMSHTSAIFAISPEYSWPQSGHLHSISWLKTRSKWKIPLRGSNKSSTHGNNNNNIINKKNYVKYVKFQNQILPVAQKNYTKIQQKKFKTRKHKRIIAQPTPCYVCVYVCDRSNILCWLRVLSINANTRYPSL